VSAQVKFTKAKIKTIKALDNAVAAMNELLRASSDVGVPYKGADDGRSLLIQYMAEFSGYLESTTEQKS
jgi:hypothetical protein